MFLKFTPFIVIALGILFGAHYLLYVSFTHLFGIININAKTILAAVLGFLSISFILSSLWIHFQKNFLTKTFYLLSGIWLGLALNLLLAILLVKILTGVSGLAGYNLNAVPVAVILFILAVAYSVYGVWNAFNPITKNIEVSVKNLPAEWQGKTIVQLSDIHLGNVYGENFMKSVVEKTNALNPDLVVITGDLFDGMDGDLTSTVTPLNDLRAPKGVLFVTGNHETYFGVQRVYDILRKTKVRILNDETIEINGIRFIGISYPENFGSKDINEVFKKVGPNAAVPTILLWHSPTQTGKAKQNGVNLQLSGHTHKGQLFPFGFITQAVYKGYDYGLHQDNNFFIYASSGVGTWGPAMRTGNRPEIVAIRLK